MNPVKSPKDMDAEELLATYTNTTIDAEERSRAYRELQSRDPAYAATLERQKELRKQDLYHDIARRLRDKQGFLFSAREFIKDQPIHYDKNRLWWLWNHKETRWELTDETELLNILTIALRDYAIGDASVKHKKDLLEALRQEGRLNKPKPFPKHWIQFKDEIFDLESKRTFPSSPEWFSINPIPWSIGSDQDTPVISKLFDEWVGPEYSETLFEIIAYCCYTGYPIHRLFCLNGGGRNGKSSYQGLTTTFIGMDNTCSVELDELTEKSNRFSSFSLYKKLCCLMGETNFNLITNANMLKKLVGGDLIKFEKKNADPFNDYNYAKIIISTNHLPPSADQSDGYYSKWIIVDFVRQFPDTKDILAGVPDYEYRNLAKKVTILLPRLLEMHRFTNEGEISDRRRRYNSRSNPLLHFIDEFYIEDVDAVESYGKIYAHYAHWCKETNRRTPSAKSFSQLISAEGFEIRRTSINYQSDTYIYGLRQKTGIADFAKPVYSPSNNKMNVMNAPSISSIGVGADRNPAPNVHLPASQAINADLVDSFSKRNIPPTLKALGPLPVEEVQKLYPVPEIFEWIRQLIADGEIIELPKGTLRVLE